MDDQHFATHADLERVRAGLIDRIGQLEVRMVERMADLEVRLVERIEQSEKRTLRWLASLFIAQTFVLVVPSSA